MTGNGATGDTTIAITGMGAVSPLGVGADTLHERWTAGTCGLADGEGVCDEFNPLETLTAKERRRTDRVTQLAIAAAEEAVGEAWDGDCPYEAERVGCIVGTAIGGQQGIETQYGVLAERGREQVSPLTIPLTMANASAATLAIRHGFRGDCFAVVTACAAGAQAIGSAIRLIRLGEADAVVAGGAESKNSVLVESAFAAMGATSKIGISRPWDRRRDGFVSGEGAGILILESAEAARRRGANVLAEIVGYGATADAHHLTAPEATPRSTVRAMRRAMEDAGVRPEDVDYVNAHGTSTPLNDRSETAALKEAFGECIHDKPVSSTKSAIGHLLGAAGAVEAVATVKALRNRVAPPTLGLEEPEEGLDLDYVPLRARPLPDAGEDRPFLGVSNSFGFGGHNAVMVIRTP